MSRMYETIYIVKPDLADEDSKSLGTKVQEIVTSLKGDIKRLEDWGVRKLAYPIQKLARGRYMYLRFDGDASMVAELERRLRIDDRVIRYQTVKLEKDVTPAAPAVQAAAPAEPAAEAAAAPAENE